MVSHLCHFSLLGVRDRDTEPNKTLWLRKQRVEGFFRI